MENVKAYILSQLVNKQITRDEAKKLLLELSGAQLHQDIAVVGLAGRFSAATSVDQFWDFLKLERDCLRDFPQPRKEDMYDILRNPYYAEVLLGVPVDEADLDRIYSPSGYMEQIDQFDAAFFGIPPLEADYMDPHQRIALEVAYEALENAGYGGDGVKGSRTGVFLGRDQTNYSYYKLFSQRHPMQLSGSWEGLVASRISYVLDLKGPCLMTDTACSASAVSIHQAVQSLLLGECDMALAGGLNLSSGGEVRSEFLSGATMDNVVSGDDAVRTFDARANGTLWGEGAGIVVLKPLARAMADRDHIRAVIKASAINNDGTSTSITAPDALMQEQVILDAWAKADVAAETISYVEAHGTGTVLGDPIEIKGLSNAFRRHTSRRQFCGIGSLKTTMGHMVAASGVASVAKVVKSLETGTLAPSANFDVPNPYVDFTDGPLYVNDRLAPWDTGGDPRRAGISSFGFIRTNAHLVLEEAPRYQTAAPGRDRYFLTVSAKTDSGIGRLLDGYAALLADSPWSLADICYTSNVGRGHYEHRVLIVADSTTQLAESVDRLREHGVGTDADRGIFAGVHAVVSDKKGELAPGDITAQVSRRLSALAEERLADHGARGDESALVEFADAYVRGARVRFDTYYEGEARRRVPLPTYPLEKVRHWAEPMRTQVRGFDTREHPLLGTEVSRSDSGAVFENTLSVERHWVLADHRIDHTAVVPGTTYLEMTRAAFAAVSASPGMHLENVFFLSPLAVEDGAGATVRTTLDRTADGYAFRVASLRRGEWITHVEGRVRALDDATAPIAVDVGASKRAATAVTDPFIADSDTGVFQFGPRWDSVRAMWENPAGALALLRLPDGVDAETATYGLHPAKLDNAVNLISQTSGQTFLPYLYKSFALYGRMPEEFYSVIRTVRDDGADGETITYDVDLVDVEGNLFARITDYTVKKVDWDRFSLEGPRRYVEVGWVPTAEATDPAPEASPTDDAVWAVIVRDTATGRRLVDDLVAQGHRAAPCYLGAVTEPDRDVYAPDEDGIAVLCRRLLREETLGILFATDITAEGESAPGPRRRFGTDALFELSRGLMTHRLKPARGLTVVGGNGWQVVDDDPAPDPYSAATAALAVVIGQEYRHLRVDVVDVDDDIDPARFARECLGGNGGAAGAGPRALRGDHEYTRRLRYADAGEMTDESPYGGGTFLVTGGAGGLGLAVAEEMAGAGAARIVLVGRRELDEPTRQRVEAIGVAEYVRCDVSDPESVRDLAGRLAADGVTLGGIVHAAGVAGDGFLATKQYADFDAVLAPKIDGGVALTELAAAHPGAFLVFFSSITALTGGPGQGDYSCANAFLDALAVRARADGIPAVSVNWPTWSEVGMAVDHGVDGGAAFHGISTRDGLAWMAHVLSSPDAGAGVPTEFNLAALREDLDRLPFSLQPEVAAAVAATADATDAGAGTDADVRLAGLADPTPTQQRVGAVYAAVLGMAEVDAFASFQDLGGNSLMTAQLLTMIDDSYPGTVDIADLFSYSTVADLAAYIDDSTAADPAAVAQPASRPDGAVTGGDAAEQLQDVLDEIGDQELISVFADAEGAGGKRG